MTTSNLIPKRNESLRLNITSITGLSNLFLHFNLTEAEKADGSDALMPLMYDAIKKRYQAESLIKQKNKDFYKVVRADNKRGFCIEIERGAVDDENDVLAVVDSAFEYVLKLDENKIDEEDLKALSDANVEAARNLAERMRKEIFQEHSYDFHIEHWEI